MFRDREEQLYPPPWECRDQLYWADIEKDVIKGRKKGDSSIPAERYADILAPSSRVMARTLRPLVYHFAARTGHVGIDGG
jgi:hypothetical protein